MNRFFAGLWEVALSLLLAIGALALSFYMVHDDYDSTGGWLAVMVALLGAAIAHWLTQRRHASATMDEQRDPAGASQNGETSKAVRGSSSEVSGTTVPAPAGADGG